MLMARSYKRPRYLLLIIMVFALYLLWPLDKSDSTKMGFAQSSGGIILRPAQRSDLERMATIAIAAFQSDPQWPWRFPNAAKYPEDHFRYTKLRFGEYLDNADAGAVAAMVAMIPSVEDPEGLEVAAFSLWQMPGFHLEGEEGGNRSKCWCSIFAYLNELFGLILHRPTRTESCA
jgi:hypothetical protein